MKPSLLVIALCVLTALFSTCAPADIPTPEVKASPQGTDVSGAKAAWEVEWESTLTRAKTEGTVMIYNQWGGTVRAALSQAFKQRFGIDAEFVPFSRASDGFARIKAEADARLYLVDVITIGTGTPVQAMKPLGLLGPLEPLLILPEVRDPGSWKAGKVPFVDKDKMVIGIAASMQRYIFYNTDAVKKGEITSYRDVLKPQYRGKIVLNDPTTSGGGNSLISMLAYHVWNPEEASEFLRKLLKEQQAVIQRDNRLQVDDVARGKFYIGLGPNPQLLAEYLSLGAPIDAAMLKEGGYVAPGAGSMAVPTRFSNPNAARVFVNWLLTREGLTVFSKAFSQPTYHAGVSTEWIDPVLLPQPNETIYTESEDFIFFRDKMMGSIKKIVDDAMK
ncbi:MAG: extracellular solute-binding protein [Chloroflexi bacterium]|nr:extracellular solute-binding protein [Chloroflexota bacterium]